MERDLVMALRPDLTEAARDVIIARRLSSSGIAVNPTFVKECRNFARTKANLQPTDECSRDEFDIAKDAFLSDLRTKHNNKVNSHSQAKANSQKIEKNLNAKRGEVSNKKGSRRFRKFLFWASTVAVGSVVLGSFGTIVGGITQFLLGAPLAALGGVGIAVFAGYLLVKHLIWPKIKALKDATNQTMKAGIDKAENEVKTLETSLASARTQELAAEQEMDDSTVKFNAINTDISRSYHETTQLENDVLLAIETIINDSQDAKDLIVRDVAIDEKPMRQHYVEEYKNYAMCMLQYNVNKGSLANATDLANYTRSARTTFFEIVRDLAGANSRVDASRQTEMSDAQIDENVR